MGLFKKKKRILAVPKKHAEKMLELAIAHDNAGAGEERATQMAVWGFIGELFPETIGPETWAFKQCGSTFFIVEK